eukprot:UN23724
MPSASKKEPVKEKKKEEPKEKPKEKTKPKKNLFDHDDDSDDLFGKPKNVKDPDDVIARKKSQIAKEAKLKIDPKKLLNKGPVPIKKKEAPVAKPAVVEADPLGVDPLGGSPVSKDEKEPEPKKEEPPKTVEKKKKLRKK